MVVMLPFRMMLLPGFIQPYAEFLRSFHLAFSAGVSFIQVVQVFSSSDTAIALKNFC